MKQLKIIALLCLFTGSALAQKYKLGEVTVAELEEKAHTKDAEAPAAVLFSKCTNYMDYNQGKGFMLYTEVEMKIKIYTKDGYEYANKQVQFYNSNGNNEKVNVSKAFTYNLVNGKVEKTKLSGDGEFDEVINDNWRRKKIMMPNVKEGSIVEYKYTIESPFEHLIPEWKFQEGIPVNHSELITKIPEYYVFNPNYRGYFTPVTTRSTNSRNISFTSKERSGNRVGTTTFNTDNVVYSENVISYVLDDLPGMRNEKFISNIDNYTAGIEHERSAVKWPNEPVKSYSVTWEDLVKTIYNFDDFGIELKKTGYFEEDIKALIAPLKTPEEKAAAIFAYVKSQMNWNEKTGYTCIAGVKKAYKEKTGNVAEINLMLTAMLRYAGLDANPVLVSTRSNKIALFASYSAYNYVVAAVKLGGKNVLLDASAKSAMPDILPIRAINWAGRLIKQDGTSESVDLTPHALSKEVVTLSAKMDNTGNLSGKARDQYYSYNAYLFRENYVGVSKESYLEELEKSYKGLEIGEYKVSNDKEFDKPVVEEYDFSYKNASDIIGDKIYFSPMLFFTKTENPFKAEKREYPIDFVFPSEDKYMINITLPEGYVVESLPASAAIGMEENIGTFRYTLQQQGNTIQMMVLSSMNYGVVPADYYDTLKNFYQKMVEKQGEKVVLKKG
jgi:transglutaminase-like putative cysteine protease